MWTGHQQPGSGGSSSSPIAWPLTSADDQLVDIHAGDAPIIGSPSASPPGSGSGSGSGSGLGGKLFHDHVQQMVRSFMIRGTHGPMQTLLDWRTYGMKVDFNTTRPGHVGWMGSDELLYKDVHFTMGAFRGFVHGLVGSARELLREVLYISPPSTTTTSTSNSNTTTSFPPIPWSGLYDDPTQGKQGWCFLQDTRTRWPVEGRQWLIQRLRSKPAMQRQFMRRGQIQAQLVAQYLSRVARFKEKLAVAIHITGGQPARAPELLSIQHVNTQASRHRNIFIEDGMVTAVTAYHKGFHASNDIKLIHRYMPRAVGELVVWYMWLVLPFTEQLTAWQAAQQQQQAGGTAGLGLGLDGDGNGQAPARQPRVGLASPSSPASTAAIAAGSGLGLASPYLWGPDAGTQRAWTPDRFREVLKRETQARLGQALNIPAYWDIAIGISRRFMRAGCAFTSDVHDEKEQQAAAAMVLDADQEEGMDAEQWMAHITDLQAAHSSHVAGMVYGRQIMEQAGTTSHRRAMFRQSSVEWHEFLGFPREEEDGHSHHHHHPPAGQAAAGAPSGSQAVRVRVSPPDSTPSGSQAVGVSTQPPGHGDIRVRVHPPAVLGKRKRAPWRAEAEEHQWERRQQLQTMDMTAAMQQMTGQARMQFRGVQASAMAAIQQGRSPVVAIMPTGGGKSMLFMLPAWAVPGGTTIVVVPLISLRQDMARRCRQVGVSCVAWDRQRPPDEAAIVLVTPESVVTSDF
ncbi:hypothetical protein ASPCAL14336 [Aspergillus calidoustus]|uniref:DEAD/DEAH-box helicase domain-containing protein n=1 Tax=Aspergillus calidoustus TaxID=454130 RepID=A0A0U5GFN1_ASPCI|nr:hypothetical protein ASPCAL14336 [Aspergillus calidoustus]